MVLHTACRTPTLPAWLTLAGSALVPADNTDTSYTFCSAKSLLACPVIGPSVHSPRGDAAATTDNAIEPCSKLSRVDARVTVQLYGELFGSNTLAVQAVLGLCRLMLRSPTLPVLRNWMGQLNEPVAVPAAAAQHDTKASINSGACQSTMARMQLFARLHALVAYLTCYNVGMVVLRRLRSHSPAFVGLVQAAASMVTARTGRTKGVSNTDFVTGTKSPKTDCASAETFSALGFASIWVVVTVREAVHMMAAPGSSTAAAGALILLFEMVHDRVSLMSDGIDSSTFLNLNVPVLMAVSVNITVSPAFVSVRGAALKDRSNTAVLSFSGTTAVSMGLETLNVINAATFAGFGGWRGTPEAGPAVRVTLPASKSSVVRALQQQQCIS